MPIDALVNYDFCFNLPPKQVVTVGSISRWRQSLQFLVLRSLLVDVIACWLFGVPQRWYYNTASFNRNNQRTVQIQSKQCLGTVQTSFYVDKVS